jgi:DNA polymerase elongation subunit (family B)
MTGEIETQDLVISKQLKMDITKYKNIFPHVAAAIQLSNADSKQPSRGDIIQYSLHQFPTPESTEQGYVSRSIRQ